MDGDGVYSAYAFGSAMPAYFHVVNGVVADFWGTMALDPDRWVGRPWAECLADTGFNWLVDPEREPDSEWPPKAEPVWRPPG